MIKFQKLKTAAAAAGICAALFAAAPASAQSVYAVSHLRIDDLQLSFSGATQIRSFTFDLAQSATLNGATSATAASCNSINPLCNTVVGPPVLNATVVNAPGSTTLRPDNVFNFNGPSAVGSLSNADSVIKTAQLTQGLPTSTEQIAESLLNTNGSARANAEIQSNTSLSAIFVGGGTVSLSFLADPDQLSSITGGQLGSFLAQSNMNAAFSLTNGSGGRIRFAPSGTSGTNDCLVSGNAAFLAAVSCLETADSQDLNGNTSAGSNPEADSRSFEVGDVLTAFGITIAGLPSDTYQVVFNANTSTSIINFPNVVPEPGTTGLIGAALAALGLTTRRRKVTKA